MRNSWVLQVPPASHRRLLLKESGTCHKPKSSWTPPRYPSQGHSEVPPLPRGPARAKTPAQAQRLCRCGTAPGQTAGGNCSCWSSKPLAFQETEGPELSIQGFWRPTLDSRTTFAKIQGHRNLNCTVSFWNQKIRLSGQQKTWTEAEFTWYYLVLSTLAAFHCQAPAIFLFLLFLHTWVGCPPNTTCLHVLANQGLRGLMPPIAPTI